MTERHFEQTNTNKDIFMLIDMVTPKSNTQGNALRSPNTIAVTTPVALRKTRDSKWLNNPDELFDWLERHVHANAQHNPNAHTKPESGNPQWAEFDTISLLNHARSIFAEANDRINRLETLTTLDPLTGLSNRRGFFQTLLKEVDAANRRHTGGGLLIMIDLDNYHNIRTNLGESAADHALKVLGNAIFKDIRTMDTAARLENEEFIVLMTHTNRAKALERAQFMAWGLNHLQMTWKGTKIPLNISLGLKEFKAGDSAEDILKSDIKTESTNA